MKTRRSLFQIFFGLLFFGLSSSCLVYAAPPAIGAVAAAQIAQKDLESRNLQGSVYIAQMLLKSKSGDKSYWEIYWSKRFPANTEGYKEIGLKIKMDGSYTRTVKR